jgi:integrase
MARKRRRGRGEGAVFYSESKGCWVGRAVVGVKPDGKPLYQEVTARTKGEVLREKSEKEDDAKAGRVGEAAKTTVGQYLQHWLDNTAKPSVEVTTWLSYERCVRLHLIPRIGGILLSRLRPTDVEKLFAKMQSDGVSGGNAKKVSEVLSTALEHAARIDLIRASPAAPIPKPKPAPAEIVPFTPDEIMRVRLAAMGNRLEALFALAIATGAREGELLALGWEHVDLEQGVLSIQRTLAYADGAFFLKERPKSHRGRRQIELPPFAVDLLHEHRKAMLAEGSLSAPVVFCTTTRNYIAKANFIRKVYRPLLAEAEVPYRKFHTFRHTHASELLARGESVVDVARRLGDSPEVVLRTYAHFIPGSGPRIAKRLEEMYG